MSHLCPIICTLLVFGVPKMAPELKLYWIVSLEILYFYVDTVIKSYNGITDTSIEHLSVMSHLCPIICTLLVFGVPL